jgi:DNA-directed RNA polymerase specialized sigma24 family protein
VELDTCRRQLERLTGAVEHERAALRAVLGRLAATGLSDEQLARLALLPVGEVRDLLGLARDALQPR